MKKIIFTALLSILTITFSFTQDIITKKTGEDILAKLIEVTSTELKYKSFDNLDGPTFTMFRSDILMIRYENGSKEIFTESQNSSSADDMRLKGIQDAMANYKGKHSGSGWTGVTTVLFSPLIGIIPAAACASSGPSENNLNYKDGESMKDNTYRLAYKEQARKTKKKKIWTNFGIASAIWLIIFAAGQSGNP